MMKTKIDALATSILNDLRQLGAISPEGLYARMAVHADPHSCAVQKREVLERYADDMSLSEEDRQFAKLKLDELPVF